MNVNDIFSCTCFQFERKILLTYRDITRRRKQGNLREKNYTVWSENLTLGSICTTLARMVR
jgi:hypothetical protein